jgi:uncharacterized protein YcbX
MARVERIRVYPVKGLEGIDLQTAEIVEGGTLRHDREFALFDEAGDVVNGKRTDRVHELAIDFDPGSGVLSVETPGGEVREFDLETERESAARWLGDFLEMDPTLRRDTALGFVDRREMGPSVVSTATLETVASWFDGMTADDAYRRLRANVAVSGVPAFWADRFVGNDAPAFEVDGVRFEGVTPCGRCVVPSRDPDTGEPTPEFREQFVRKRRETFPEWADEGAFDHYYSLMLITRVPEASGDQTVRVGAGVDVVE